MKFLRHIYAVFFLLLSLQVVIPAQLWHELMDHTDTHDCTHENGVTSVSTAHEHCFVLEINLPQIFHEQSDFYFFSSEIVAVLNFPHQESPQIIFNRLQSDRGPPAIG